MYLQHRVVEPSTVRRSIRKASGHSGARQRSGFVLALGAVEYARASMEARGVKSQK